MSAVVLVSGGLDSSTLLHYVAKSLGVKEIHAVSFNYGQKHVKELVMAERQCRAVAEVVSWRVIDVSYLADLVGGASALTCDEVAVPELGEIAVGERDQPVTYVPNRNMILLSLAASFAESVGAGVMYYGAQAQDEYGYWDCTPAFIEQLNGTLALNRRVPVQIVAPFTTMRKGELLRLGLELGVNYADTWTCYRGGEKACGVCPTCVERVKAWEEVRLEDPLAYEADE